MTQAAQRLYQKALDLTADDRAKLPSQLVESLARDAGASATLEKTLP